MSQLTATNVHECLVYTAPQCILQLLVSSSEMHPGSTRYASNLLTMGGSITLQGSTTVKPMHGGRSTCPVIQECPGAEQNGETTKTYV